MFVNNQHFLNRLGFIVLSFSIVITLLNQFWLGFPGLFYFQPTLVTLVVLIILVRIGLKIQFESIEHTALWKMLHASNSYILIIALIIFSTGAIQYTPFKVIDNEIVTVEHYLHLHLESIISWTNSHSLVHLIAGITYDSLEGQIIFLPILVIIARQYDVAYEFCFLVLTTWLIGASIYFFFPTAGPASVIDSPYFELSQRATGLKFWQLHHYIQPTSADGGLIAMPSFHVIWAWLLVYLLRPWRFAFSLLLVINSTMMASCVLLGWHYFLDVAGSFITLLTSHGLYYYFHKSQERVVGQRATDLLPNIN